MLPAGGGRGPMKNYTDDELLPPTPEQTEYLRASQDPYAKLSVTLKEPAPVGAVAVQGPPKSQRKGVATQKEFETTFRRIIGFYVPESERSRLPAAYRDFLERNKVRSATTRFKLMERLRQYDLSDVGVETYFNREEREILTEARLREIEQSVSDEE
jgi:hypothetical protein